MKKPFYLHIDQEVLKQFRILAIKKEKSNSDLAEDAFREYIQKHIDGSERAEDK